MLNTVTGQRQVTEAANLYRERPRTFFILGCRPIGVKN